MYNNFVYFYIFEILKSLKCKNIYYIFKFIVISRKNILCEKIIYDITYQLNLNNAKEVAI